MHRLLLLSSIWWKHPWKKWLNCIFFKMYIIIRLNGKKISLISSQCRCLNDFTMFPRCSKSNPKAFENIEHANFLLYELLTLPYRILKWKVFHHCVPLCLPYFKRIFFNDHNYICIIICIEFDTDLTSRINEIEER